ncbi:PQQ-binding-like beta-propeller repeat protein [Halomicroarcula sp. GCM10025709]|uniref:outer membrane protein assembly factor BamB family protein n=1 Tax=Haloarcula TaxID=2237 RepID=UPI0024C32025|nr:PQQ-binding-like beta-propeller repeat protein [Halomicroarcula sp. YJ-61-S]
MGSSSEGSDEPRRVSRRRLLASVATTLGTAGIGGCLRSDIQGTTATPTGRPETAAATPTPGARSETAVPETPTETRTAFETPEPNRAIAGEWSTAYYDAQNTAYAADATGPGVDAETKWRADIDANIFPGAGPAVVDNTVLMGVYGGALLAFDGRDGSERWRASVGDDVYATPAVADGTAVFGSVGGKIHAVSVRDGSEQWAHEIGYPPNVPVTIVDDTVYAVVEYGYTEGAVIAVDLATGRRQWRTDTGTQMAATPAVADGTVYVGSGDTMYALDAATGQEQWTSTGNGGRYRTATVDGGRVYVTTGDGNVLAFDRDDGATQWSRSIGTEIPVGPARSPAGVVVADESGTVRLLTPSDGTVRWSTSLGTRRLVRGHPTVTPEAVYVGNYRIDLADGTVRGTVGPGQSAHQSVVAGGTLLYTVRGQLVAVQTEEPPA